MAEKGGEKGPGLGGWGSEDDEKRGRRLLHRCVPWCVPVWVSVSQGVCVCVCVCGAETDKDKQIQGSGDSFSVGSGKEASARHCSLQCIPVETW